MNSSQRKTVLLIDSQVLVRNGIKLLLESTDQYQVIAEASTNSEALNKLDVINPDIIISELTLSDRTGIELLYELKRRHRNIPVIILTYYNEPHLIRNSLGAGAKGYILKSDQPEQLWNALNDISLGKTFLSQSLSSFFQPKLSRSIEQETISHNDPLELLSPREREIFHHLASGLQNSTIAKKLFISPRTVETHRARIVKKLSLNSNADLIRFAIRNGLSPA